jgi:hypothetical protein
MSRNADRAERGYAAHAYDVAGRHESCEFFSFDLFTRKEALAAAEAWARDELASYEPIVEVRLVPAHLGDDLLILDDDQPMKTITRTP